MFHIIWPKGYAELPAKKKLKRRDWKNFLTNRLYPSNLIKNGISRAKQERQEISQEPSKTDQRNLIPFITTYNPRNPDIFPVIQKKTYQY